MEAETKHLLEKYMWMWLILFFSLLSYIFQDQMKQFLVGAFCVI